MWIKVSNLTHNLFPKLEESLGKLSPKEIKLIKILDFAEIENFVQDVKITNPPKDRKEMARAFVAKQVYNFHTTRDLIDRLHKDKSLRIVCGWRYANEIPSESKFSRVFAEFAQQKIAVKAQEKFISTYLSETIFFYNSTDSTAIELREKAVKKESKEPKKKYPVGRPKKGEKREPKEPTRLEKQSKNIVKFPKIKKFEVFKKPLGLLDYGLCGAVESKEQTTEEMLSTIPTACDIGIKKDAKGHRNKWRGGKLHISCVDGDIPITAIYSSASVHDSSLALPMIQETSSRVNYLYDLNDSAYHANIIKEFSQKNGHIQIVDINPKNSQKLRDEIEAEKMLVNMGFDTKKSNHYNNRSSVERVNGYLKDNFGCRQIYYQGTKVVSVLDFAILSLCIHQSLKMLL